MVFLVVFGAYAEYNADEYLRISKLRVTGTGKVQEVFENCGDIAVKVQLDVAVGNDVATLRLWR